jgi:hypothetical protein
MYSTFPPHERYVHRRVFATMIACDQNVVPAPGPVLDCIEECGDRDAARAQVGGILQGLIAGEPAERRPSIR